MIDVRARADGNVAEAIERFYKDNDGFSWVDANGVTGEGAGGHGGARLVADVGLDPLDYAVVDPTDTFGAVDAVTRQRQLMQFEIELSVAALTFIQDTRRGRIDPKPDLRIP